MKARVPRGWTPADGLRFSEIAVLDALQAHADADGRIAVGTTRLRRITGIGATSIKEALTTLAERRAVELVTPGTVTSASLWRVLISVEDLAEAAGLRDGIRI